MTIFKIVPGSVDMRALRAIFCAQPRSVVACSSGGAMAAIAGVILGRTPEVDGRKISLKLLSDATGVSPGTGTARERYFGATFEECRRVMAMPERWRSDIEAASRQAAV